METRKVDFTNRSAPWSHLGTDISDCLSVEDTELPIQARELPIFVIRALLKRL